MTVKQKQCLLCYLGYYDGGIDGIRGSKTAAAEAAFGKDHGGFSPESLLAAVTRPEDFWQQIPNFRREEFRGKTAEQVLAFVKAQSQTHYAYAIDKNFLHMDVTEP